MVRSRPLPPPYERNVCRNRDGRNDLDPFVATCSDLTAVFVPVLFRVLLIPLDQREVLFFDLGEEAFYVDSVGDVPGSFSNCRRRFFLAKQ